MKKFLIWFGAFIAITFTYIFLTDATGWMFGEESGLMVRRFVGFVAVSVVIGRLADKIVERFK